MFGILNFGHCYLFVSWDLLFVIFQLVNFPAISVINRHFSGLSWFGVSTKKIEATFLTLQNMGRSLGSLFQSEYHRHISPFSAATLFLHHKAGPPQNPLARAHWLYRRGERVILKYRGRSMICYKIYSGRKRVLSDRTYYEHNHIYGSSVICVLAMKSEPV